MNGDIFLLPLYVLKARRGTILPLRCNTENNDSRLDLIVRCPLQLMSYTVPEISWRKKCVDIRRPLTLWLLQGLKVVESPVFVFDL